MMQPTAIPICISLILLVSACASNESRKYADEFYEQGVVWYEKQEYDRSIESFTKALEMSPDADDTYRVHFNRGMAYYKNRDYDQAIYDFTKSIETAPKTDKETLFSSYYSRGNVWQEKREYRNAIVDYNKALSSNPRDPDIKHVYQSLGWAWLALQEYDKAIAGFSTALGIDTKLASSYYGRGLAWYYKGDYSRSAIDAKEAVYLRPDNKAYDDLVYKARSAMKDQ